MPAPSSTTSRVPSRGAKAVVAALVVALVAFLLARALGADMAIPATPGDSELTPLGIPMVVIFTLVVGVAATVFAWLLARFAPARAATIFTVTAVAILLLSLVPVSTLGLAGTDVLALSLLHVVVGAAILLPLRDALRSA